jgi:putative tryptophan/tyrosine transport system substrate-binding protein
MNRREFIAGSASVGLLAGGALGWLCGARAQQQNLPVIGILDFLLGHLATEVGHGLADNGFVEGREFKFDHLRRAEYQPDQLAKNAAELVERQVALILAFSNRAALAAKTATSTTPIIFLADDPVAAGLVDSLNRPGGNLTGAAGLDSDLTAKRIAIVRELVPTTRLVVLVTDPTNRPAHDIEIREAQAAAEALGLRLSIIAWTGEQSIEPDLVALPRDRSAVLVFGGGLPFFVRRGLLAHLAVYYGIPAIHGFREAVEDGGLVSFGTRLEDGWQLMGAYAARVLKGDKPADLPVQQIARTELIINPWTAKSLGLAIPSTLLARADEVIG